MSYPFFSGYERDEAFPQDTDLSPVPPEFKLNGSAQEALEQIKDKGYAKPYAADSRKIIALGINFSSEKGTIDEFMVQSS